MLAERYRLRYRFRISNGFAMCSSVMSSTNAIASPVDFISGPSSLVTSGNLSHENTGSFTAKPVSEDSNSPLGSL